MNISVDTRFNIGQTVYHNGMFGMVERIEIEKSAYSTVIYYVVWMQYAGPQSLQRFQETELSDNRNLIM